MPLAMTTFDLKILRNAHPTRAGELAQMLAKAHRFGAPVDQPEGDRYVQMSDTLAREIEAWLCQLALDLRESMARDRTTARTWHG